MNRLLFIIYVVLCSMLCSQADVFAQRTSAQRAFIGASQVATIRNYPSPGLDISGGLDIKGGQYLLNSYWHAGARVTNWNWKTESNDAMIDYVLWGVYGGWSYRIISTYSRFFNVYAGAIAFLGCNHYEVFKKLPAELTGTFPKSEFAYGVEPSLECEIFLGSRIALLIGAQLPITFSRYFSSGMWHPTASLGFRINL